VALVDPHLKEVRYPEVYPGIDLVYYGNQRNLEYDFVVAPGADPGAIAWRMEGADGATVGTDGALRMAIGNREVRQEPPVAYQEAGGVRRPVSCSYELAAARGEVRFKVGPYDPSLPLTIDPVVQFATYFGGSGYDYLSRVISDSAGNPIAVGNTASVNYPVVSPYQGSKLGLDDMVLTKFSADGSSVLFSTYIGGTYGGAEESANCVVLDSTGNIWISGIASSADFPTTANGYDRVGSDYKGAILQFNSAGSTLLYGSFFGSSSDARVTGLAFDASGRVYLCGYCTSGLPVLNAYQATHGGNWYDAFFAVLDTSLPPASQLIYSTYLGGGGEDSFWRIAVDGSGRAIVTGYSNSGNFPTFNGYQMTSGGGYDGVVAMFDPSQSGAASLVYSTYLGGSGDDRLFSLVRESADLVWVFGYGNSSNFPITASAVQKVAGGGNDWILAKLDTSLTGAASFLYGSTYGGSGADNGATIARAGNGNLLMVGRTASTNFPTHQPFQAANGGGSGDAAVVILDPSGGAVLLSSYYGGTGDDEGQGIASTPSGAVLVSGYTESLNFPTVAPYQGAHAGGVRDAFLMKLNPPPPPLGLASQSFFGGAGDQFGRAVVVGAGSVYLAGDGGADPDALVAA
jgi:hypothetical protein